VEQPFPAALLRDASEVELASWRRTKRMYEEAGILLFADESVCTADDVATLAPYVHGFNFKLEKAGGVREST
jgi:L-alanine-DL-glutamate epimerase-like enolase superfamily enzyme